MSRKIRIIFSDKSPVIYKLLHDTLLILLMFFVLSLIAEGALPGLIASHFGLYKIAILILINTLAIISLGKFLGISLKSKMNKKITYPLFFILALLVFNSLLKLNILLNLFILVFLFITAYFLVKTLQEE